MTIKVEFHNVNNNVYDEIVLALSKLCKIPSIKETGGSVDSSNTITKIFHVEK